jgi:hypothetical protein
MVSALPGCVKPPVVACCQAAAWIFHACRKDTLIRSQPASCSLFALQHANIAGEAIN